ncbi:plasma-membrane proton-efflux P-type ATPase [Candidatus Marsarchaeota archaeon]|nr:plasma-membrane proton-efflux P-type ATPase [Candidatus Marsarchaeota archaeon]
MTDSSVNSSKTRFDGVDVTRAFKELRTSARGLAGAEADERIRIHGGNEIPEKKKNPAIKFLKNFSGPIPLMLEAVILISYFLGNFKDMYIILALLIFNSIVTFIEERKADNSLELLRDRLAVNAKVLRDDKWSVRPARELVEGDVVSVKTGDIVPADLKVISSQDLMADESVLTGETKMKPKPKNSAMYSGSAVKQGTGLCLVIGTGYNTYFGRTTKLIEVAKPEMHLEKDIFNIVKYIVAIDFLLVVFMALWAVFVFKYPATEMLPFSLVLLIASVPVALPAAITVSTAVGTERLSKKSILITRLQAIEEASGINVVCFDKTGTITKNVLEVKEVFPLGRHSEKDVVVGALLASDRDGNDPIDSAIISYSGKTHCAAGKSKQISFIPFTPATKYASAKISTGKETFTVTKGSIEVLAGLSRLCKKDMAKLMRQVKEYSGKEFRTIGVMKKRGKNPAEFLGIIAMYDEPRKDAASLIKELRGLGISIKMLTGDDIVIARQIAGEVGIGGNIISAGELKGKSVADVNDLVENSDGFAGIYPEDKFLIVKALQSKGYRVAMTGDGINDAPACKQADIGICVENGADIAKSVASIVLMKNGINVIVDAIKESRKIFERIRVYAMFKLIRIFQLLLFIFIIFVSIKVVPITALMLILLIFTTDIANISISTDNVAYSKSPDIWNIKDLVKYSFSLSAVFFMFLLVMSFFSMPFVTGTKQFQTFVFLMFDITSIMLLYSIRSQTSLFGRRPSKYLVIASLSGAAFGVIASLFGIFIPKIGIYPVLLVLGFSALFVLLFDVIKIKIYKHLKMQ